MVSARTGGPGSNQYRSRGKLFAVPSLLGQAGPPTAGGPRGREAQDREANIALRQVQAAIAERLELARDTKTAPELLAELAASPLPAVRGAALSNPETPPGALQYHYMTMGGMTYVSDSPALQHELRLLLSNPACPAWVCADAAAYEGDSSWHNATNVQLQRLAGSHPNCPVETVQQQWGPPDGWDLYITGDLSNWWSKKGPGHGGLLRILHWPAQLLDSLAAHPDWNVRANVAGNVFCPPATLQRLAADSTKTVALSVASNPHTPAPALDLLLRHKDRGVSHAAFRNPGLSKASRAMWQLVNGRPGGR
jgi:hypothetical protein